MPKVEFKHTGKPQNQQELVEHIEDIRSAVLAGGTATDEALERVASDLKAGYESVDEAKKTRKRVDELEEMVKVLHESGRVHGDDKIERQLRSLPIVHKVEKDEDFRGKMTPPGFNLMALSRKELKLYLSGEALEWAIRFRRLNNMARSAHDVISLLCEEKPERREAYNRAGGIKGLPLWGALQECYKQGARALSTGGAATGAEWIPTGYSAEKFDDVRDLLELANNFRWIPMPMNPYVLPTLIGFMKAYVIPEANNNTLGSNTIFTASDFTTANRTITAKKLATISYFSPEEEQDSIIPLLPTYDEEQNYAQAVGLDQAVLNGQLTSTIDTGAVPASTDPAGNFDGLRWAAQQVGGQVDLSAGLTPEKLAAMIQAMGKYANPRDCKYVTGYVGLAKALVLKDGNGNLVYLTREHAGEAATLFTGTVGVLMGYPLVIAGVYPGNMNANGIIDGAVTTKTGILLVNTRPWIGGNRLGIEVDVDRSERFSYDQVGIRSKQRVAFKSLLVPSAAKPFVIAGVGL
jgi:HK97 family phage major capsid protein